MSAPDKEARLLASDHRALRLWLRLWSCTHLIEGRIRQGLRERFDTTLPRFDLLAQLERRPQGLTMTELSQQMMVTGANITALTDSLEAQGYVARTADDTDRRVYRVCLTDTGRAEFSKMAEVHEGWVVDALSGISPAQIDDLYTQLAALKLHLQNKTNV